MNHFSFICGIVVCLAATGSSVFGQHKQKTSRPKKIRGEYVSKIECLRDSDEAWLIKMPDDEGGPDPEQLTVKQQQNAWQEELEPTQCGWADRQLADLTEAHLADPTKQTVIYIHGWRATECSALRQANQVYAAMKRSPDLPPVRFVYLVWKAAKSEKRLRTDYLQKSEYSKVVGKCLLPIMQQFQNRDVVLVGHSLGAQVILSFLTQLNMLPDDGSRYKTVLLGAALECKFSADISRQYTQKQYQTSRTLVFNNSRDFAIRLSSRRICPPQLQPGAGKIAPIVEQKLVPLGETHWTDLRLEVGCRHDVAYYVAGEEFPPLFSCLLNSDE